MFFKISALGALPGRKPFTLTSLAAFFTSLSTAALQAFSSAATVIFNCLSLISDLIIFI